jgi:hypothetical protein
MVKHIKLLIVIFSLVFGFSVGTVNANTYNLGTISGVNGSAFPVSNGSFTDYFDFTLASTSDMSVSASPLNLSVGTPPILFFDITGLQVTFDGSTFAGDNTTHNFSSLAAGNYKLEVSGTSNGLQGGIYGIVSNVTAVPEPETYAMMFAGLGLMGFTVRRRKTKET